MRSNPVDKNRLEQHGRQKKKKEKIVSLALLQMVRRVPKTVLQLLFFRATVPTVADVLIHARLTHALSRCAISELNCSTTFFSLFPRARLLSSFCSLVRFLVKA